MMKREIESYEADTPTRRLFDQLSDAFERINSGLFGGQLPHLEREAKARQRAAGEAFGKGHPKADQKVDQAFPDAPSTTQARAAQSLDLAAKLTGTNRQYVAIDQIFDQPPLPETGARVSHYIVEGGPFDLLADKIIAAGFRIDWASLDQGTSKSPEKNKVKYTCPECQTNIWGKPGIVAMCQPCESLFVTESDAPAWTWASIASAFRCDPATLASLLPERHVETQHKAIGGFRAET